jgi:DNA (cytosine-5)-methyltransferase 1
MSKRKLTGISLFSSAGIAETYFEDANIEIKFANEIEQKRCDFFKHLYPKVEMLNGNIQDENIKNKIINASKGKNFLIATPPCQGFSTLGITKKTDKLLFDKRNFLIFDVIDVITNSDFDFILIENVPRFFKLFYPYKDNFEGIEYILNDLFGNKYNILTNVFDAKDFGVPQYRKRAIIRMYKKNHEWEDPELLKSPITLNEAIGHLPSLEPGESSGIKFHDAKVHNERDILAMKHTPEGKSALLNDFFFPKKIDGSRISGFHNTYKRMKWDEPAKARTTNCGNIGSHNNVHPGKKLNNGTYSDPRVLTLLETFIVTSLPEDWNVPDWASDSFIRKMIGEAIPPLMCKKIIEKIKFNENK